LKHLPKRGLGLAGVLAAIALAVLPAASAQAALITTSPCDGAKLSQPFLPWGDSALYRMVPGGDFEGSLSGWTLSGGAHTVAGSEPYAATGALGSTSLDLPAGASVQTPFTCVDAAYPTFRFFAKNNSLLSAVAVSVVYRVPLVGQVTIPVGVVALSPKWAPNLLPMLTGSIATSLLSGGTAQVSLRFTALTGNTQIDDIYIDPRCMGA
jgi:hypothetical protein